MIYDTTVILSSTSKEKIRSFSQSKLKDINIVNRNLVLIQLTLPQNTKITRKGTARWF